jgi:hypothetical protein
MISMMSIILDFQELNRTLSAIGELRQRVKWRIFLKVWVKKIVQIVKMIANPPSLRFFRKLCIVSILRQNGQPSPIQSWS